MGFGKGSRVLIVGATSGIARHVAQEFARHGASLVLAARDQDELECLATDLEIRSGARVEKRVFSALDYDSHRAFWESCGQVDGVVVCFGYYPPEADARRDWELCQQLLEINYNAVISLVNIIANDFEARESGFIAVLSSVAGERGRTANYLYGSTKSGVTAYTEGLRMRLFKAGVTVTTVKPGPVDTGMTWSHKAPLLAPPEKVASDIYRGIRRKADVVYTPAVWRVIMGIMRLVPEMVWKRLDF